MLIKSTGVPVIPTILDDIFSGWSPASSKGTIGTPPAVNIKETDNDFMVEMAVPGMDKKDFQIDLDDNILTISSEDKEEKKETKENYTLREYRYNSFKRSFTLPKNVVDSDHIKATYINGELRIAIPKRQEAKPKPARLIEVK